MDSTNKVISYSDTFSSKFSLLPLLKYWEKQIEKNKVFALSYDYINEKLKKAPELLQPITDPDVIAKNYELIEELLNICLSPAIYENEFYAAVYPDRLDSFYSTPAFKRLQLFENQMNSSCFNENCCLTPDGKAIACFAWIMVLHYGLNINYEYPIIYTLIDTKTNLERHYRIRIYTWFCELKIKGELKQISKEEKKRLFENLDDPKILAEILPPDNFDIEGFLIYNAVDITDQEVISSLKFDLIQKESHISQIRFENLQHKLRVLLRKPDIKLGLIAFPTEKKDMKNALKMGSSIILQDTFIENEIATEFKIYDDVLNKRQVKIIYDINNYACSNKVREAFANSGLRNLLIAPLIYKDELIGILEIASSLPGDLNKINILKLTDVYPLLAICIESSLDDLNKSIQSIIKERCTAIHPSVEWRFREAARVYLNNLRNNVIIEMEDIVFENIYPFYGYSDVKDSSVSRNSAVRDDLIENLKLVQEIILTASHETDMPILEELSFRISGHMQQLKEGKILSIEMDAINFLRTEVEATLVYLKDLNPEIKVLISNYKEKLDPGYGFIFNKRKDIEDSLMLINETISTELDIQQSKAQKIFPHYFEKYKTDGVEYNMYLGSSLVEGDAFNQMHLKSLRLWQLVTMCIITKRCIELKHKLSVPLDTTHLIFVQNATLSIKFFYDEKKFDVAGSYDIRHEIIKKRIDKAVIKGSDERLSAPGKIAIVYSQESEAEDYRQYINFLKTKNYITSEIESFELADMQGIHGLKALRITVNSNLITDKNNDESKNDKTLKT
ncbi:MAG: GAF domain-containing protein, partial [Ignavibacteria bacterium]